MKKIKANQMGAWCSFCSPKTTRAVWREAGMGSGKKHACDEHREALAAYEREESKRDDYMSEADYQTWGRY